MKEDSRFYSWPPIRKHKNSLLIRARLLTPLRVELFNACIRNPLHTVWKLSLFLLIIELITWGINWPRLSYFIPITASGLSKLIFALCALHYAELFSRMWITSVLFGKWISVRVTDDEVIVRTLFKKRIFSREQHIVFAAVPIPQSEAPGYLDSKLIEIVVDNSATFRFVECYDPRKAGRFVVNCNYAISRSDHSAQSEFDPRER